MRYIGIIGGVVAALAFAATATAGSFEDKAQVTVSGGEYMLNGYIVKIEGDAYWIRKASGDVVRVAVTEGTHLICPTRNGNKEAKVESKPGAGFRMGDCPFIPGDTVKVEVTDLGSASLIRFDVPPVPETVNLGLPQGWDGYMPNGVLSFKTGPRYPVYTKDGHPVGHLGGTLTDTVSGTEYGLIELEADGEMMAVPRTEMRQEWSEPNKPRVALLITKNKFEEMHPPAFSAANQISIPKLRDFWAKAEPPEPFTPSEVDVVIDISEKTFQITKGGTARGFALMAGMPAVIKLLNRDLVAHEFMSTLFRDVPFRISGNATVVKTARASGLRIDPGQTVTLEFTAPVAQLDRYGDRATIYDVFWCNVHGKEHGQTMRGELAIIETTGIGGG
ncbi:MAG: hypothetical protein OJF51_005059 [Nitrospira sp.]|jgi:hypothetical protein|nr:MAG: hypothetical protein OJF51_005059 [Nitrospira sp.]